MYPWGDNRRFNSYVRYFKEQFGKRVQKLTLDAGFTCPNRDGKVAYGGCSYCNNDAFNPSYCSPEKSITQQLEEGIEFHAKRYRRAEGYLAYFQAFSNTYAPLPKLQSLYNEALNFPGVIGLVIGTRPDCINDDLLSYLKDLSEQYYIIIEYGVESCNDRTLQRINRGHDFKTSVEAIEKTSRKGIKVGAHIMFGLPGETRDEMLKGAEILSSLPLNTIKFHQLQIIKGTKLAEEFFKNPESILLFTLDDYIDFITEFIENLNPDFVIERIASESPPYTNISPVDWVLRNYEILQKFERKLAEKNTWQGKFFHNNSLHKNIL